MIKFLLIITPFLWVNIATAVLDGTEYLIPRRITPANTLIAVDVKSALSGNNLPVKFDFLEGSTFSHADGPLIPIPIAFLQHLKLDNGFKIIAAATRVDANNIDMLKWRNNWLLVPDPVWTQINNDVHDINTAFIKIANANFEWLRKEQSQIDPQVGAFIINQDVCSLMFLGVSSPKILEQLSGIATTDDVFGDAVVQARVTLGDVNEISDVVKKWNASKDYQSKHAELKPHLKGGLSRELSGPVSKQLAEDLWSSGNPDFRAGLLGAINPDNIHYLLKYIIEALNGSDEGVKYFAVSACARLFGPGAIRLPTTAKFSGNSEYYRKLCLKIIAESKISAD